MKFNPSLMLRCRCCDTLLTDDEVQCLEELDQMCLTCTEESDTAFNELLISHDESRLYRW